MLNPKATVAYVDAQLLLKANITDMNTALALKSDKLTTYTITQVDSLLNPKATVAYVDAQLLWLKADRADMTSALALKKLRIRPHTP